MWGLLAFDLKCLKTAKVSRSHWTTPMQGTLDITGAGYEYALYAYIPVMLFLHKGYNSVLQQWCDWRGTKVQTSPWLVKCKNEVPFCLYFGIQHFFVFIKLLFCAFCGKFWRGFWRFRILVYRNPNPDPLSFQNFFSECWRWALILASVGLFQLCFPRWLKPLTRQQVYNLIFLNNFY